MCLFKNPSLRESKEMAKRCREIAGELAEMRLCFAVVTSNVEALHRLFVASDVLEDVSEILDGNRKATKCA